MPNRKDVSKTGKFAEDVIEARFEKVQIGISASNVFGGEEQELQVIIDPEKLAAKTSHAAATSRCTAREKRRCQRVFRIDDHLQLLLFATENVGSADTVAPPQALLRSSLQQICET